MADKEKIAYRKLNGNYSCYIYVMNNEGILTACGNTACFAGIRRYLQGKNDPKEFIYIKYFDFFPIKEIKMLLKHINKITPCYIDNVNGKSYIKFRLLPTYDNNLILLNFIRPLWYNSETHYCSSTFMHHIVNKTSNFRDPLKVLLDCFSKCVTLPNRYGAGDHSNAHKNIIIKPAKDLFKYTGTSTTEFLTQSTKVIKKEEEEREKRKKEREERRKNDK